jgi:uncharacterized protein YndB with AHSA1/START domain
MKNEPIVKEVLVNAPAAKVWHAITDPVAMKQWYFDITGFKPEVGTEFHFEGSDKDNCYLHLCKITEVIETEKLAYTWRYDGYPGDSLVTFELFTEGDQTRVRLTHEGLESFAGAGLAFAKENFVAGWNDLIGKLLKEYVENENH